jgi:type IV pilus assembly protein PilY1
MKNTLLKVALGAGLLSVQLTAPATDLDLYVNPSAANAQDLPNVLFIIDNTANWNTAFTNEMAALKATVRNMPANKFNIGVMLQTETGGDNGGLGGGYVRAAIRPMTAANKVKYEAFLNSLDKLADKSNGGSSGVGMVDAYQYFNGGAPYGGNYKGKTDFVGNTGGTAASNALYALPGNALNSYSSTTYNSPVVPGSCAKNYIIYISNGPNQESSSDDTAGLNKLYAAAGGGAAGSAAIATMSISPSGSQSNPMDEWARFMKKSPLGITTYMIDVDPVTSGQGPGWTALLKSTSGLSNYVAVTSGNGGLQIAEAINDALSKIQSVNSVFAAVSLPASANVQGAYLNQLYIGMFRPDADTKPRWLGNLKQYQMGASNNLVDQDGLNAINTQTGFIAECARSFWTGPRPTAGSPDDYWINDPKGACIPAGNLPNLYANANSPDGNIVEKGAQAGKMRAGAPSARVVKTCSPSTAFPCTTMVDFNTTTAAGVSALSTERSELVNFARGQNIDGELSKSTTEMRPSAHGDVIHSNPLALSYGTNVIVFYGSNDGMLHAINGNRTANYGSVVPGAELWSFMPPEYFPNVKRIRDNDELVSMTPPVGGTASGMAKPYGIDGPITGYSEGTSTLIYASMRRGGRAVYSFDVSNPAAPSLKWHTGCSLTSATCSLGASQIGQTWSTPHVARVKGYMGGATPILIMGGGYDDCEDSDVNTCGATTKGKTILFLDALSGAVIRSMDIDRGVVGEVKVVPDADGYAKYAYAADLGGNIWRITMGNVAPSAWTYVKIAQLGCDTTNATCAANRKFMFAPSVIPETDGSYSLYVGTGDREKPLGSAFFPQTVGVRNYFFKVKDMPEDATWFDSERANCQGNAIICLNSLSSVGNTAATCGVSVAPTGKGWLLGLRPTEQVVTVAATRFGITTFSTHMPDVPVAGVCGAKLGTVHVYNIDIGTAKPIAGTTCADEVKGGGLPPPPKKVDVCKNADCSTTESICIGCSTESSIQSTPNGVPPSTLGSNAKRRVYWYIQK